MSVCLSAIARYILSPNTQLTWDFHKSFLTIQVVFFFYSYPQSDMVQPELSLQFISHQVTFSDFIKATRLIVIP